MEIRMFEKNLNEGENKARTLQLTVDGACAEHEIRLAFLTPAGRRLLTPPIPLIDGSAQYELPACVLDAGGRLLAQIIAESDTLQITKSEVFGFDVDRSIPTDGADTDGETLITLGGVHDGLLDLQETVALCARRSELPAVPERVSAFENDADYATRAYVLDTVAAAEREAVPAHTHDDRYYTQMQTDALLQAKADGDDVTAALAGKAEALIVTAEVDFENGWVINPSTTAKVIYDASAAGKIVVGRFSHTKNGTATTTDMLLQSCCESGINLHTCVFAASDEEYHYSVLLNTLYYQCSKSVISPQEKTGTFTPSTYSSAPEMASIKQYGKIVVVTMWLPIFEAGTGTNTLGHITGVGKPNGNYANCSCITRTPGGPAHTALLTIEVEQDETLSVRLNAQEDNPNDTYVIFNCVYTTE